MIRPSAPLAACGLVLTLLALVTLARPRGAVAVPRDPVAVAAPAPVQDSEQRRRLLRSEVIDINLATAEELELLPRIGPTLALRIVDERERGGRFETIQGLTRVRGIGPRTVERLRPLVAVAPANVPARLAP